MTGLVKERSILFSGPMLRAILAGQKTVTRRVIKAWQTPERQQDGSWFSVAQRHSRRGFGVSGATADQCGAELARSGVCPYGRAGERLWVRETWGIISHDFDEQGNMIDWQPDRPATAIREMRFGQGYYSGHVIYRADGPAEWAGDHDSGGERRFAWKTPIHMPRVASRILLEITDVRVERLQNIDEDQARAEGVMSCEREIDPDGNDYSPRELYSSLWTKINGQGSWQENPWVWVVEFKRLMPALPATEHEQ